MAGGAPADRATFSLPRVADVPPRSPEIVVHRPVLLVQVAVGQFFHSIPPLSGDFVASDWGQSAPRRPPASGSTKSTTYLVAANPPASAARVQVSPPLAELAIPLSSPAYRALPGAVASVHTDASDPPLAR